MSTIAAFIGAAAMAGLLVLLLVDRHLFFARRFGERGEAGPAESGIPAKESGRRAA